MVDSIDELIVESSNSDIKTEKAEKHDVRMDSIIMDKKMKKAYSDFKRKPYYCK